MQPDDCLVEAFSYHLQHSRYSKYVRGDSKPLYGWTWEGACSIAAIGLTVVKHKLSQVRWDIRRFGLRGAMVRLARSAAYHFWLHLSPSGWQEREFDQRHGVETDGNVGKHELELNTDSLGYYPSKPRLIKSMVKRLPIDPIEFTFIDVGCGKGRPLAVAHQMGFKKLVGVEMSRALAEIAAKNTRKIGARIVRCDASEFGWWFCPGDLVVYMYNPFVNPTMSIFVDRLSAWVLISKVKVYVIYLNPFCEEPLASSRQFRKLRGVENEYALYESQLESQAEWLRRSWPT